MPELMASNYHHHLLLETTVSGRENLAPLFDGSKSVWIEASMVISLAQTPKSILAALN